MNTLIEYLLTGIYYVGVIGGLTVTLLSAMAVLYFLALKAGWYLLDHYGFTKRVVKAMRNSKSKQPTECERQLANMQITASDIYHKYSQKFGRNGRDAEAKAEAFDELLDDIHKLGLGEIDNIHK